MTAVSSAYSMKLVLMTSDSLLIPPRPASLLVSWMRVCMTRLKRYGEAALADALVLVVGVGVAVGVEDLEEWALVYGLDLVNGLFGKSHSLQYAEERLVVKAVKCFFPI